MRRILCFVRVKLYSRTGYQNLSSSRPPLSKTIDWKGNIKILLEKFIPLIVAFVLLMNRGRAPPARLQLEYRWRTGTMEPLSPRFLL